MSFPCKYNENNDKEKKTKEEIKSYFNINPLSLHIKLLFTFIDTEKEEYSNPISVTSIYILKNNNIGIILDKKYLSIYSSNTFKLINSIEPRKNYSIINEVEFLELIDFIKLKNNDLLLWNSENIIIYEQIKGSYELLNNK